MTHIDEAFRLERAATVKALVDAIRSIPSELSPTRRARTQAIREQIYHGYEVPMARHRNAARLWSKYEYDRPWSLKAVMLAESGALQRGKNMLNRDHVWEAAHVVDELMERDRSVEETADLLDQRLETCTVTHEEHRALRKKQVDTGWARYRSLKIAYAQTYDQAKKMMGGS